MGTNGAFASRRSDDDAAHYSGVQRPLLERIRPQVGQRRKRKDDALRLSASFSSGESHVDDDDEKCCTRRRRPATDSAASALWSSQCFMQERVESVYPWLNPQ